MFSHKSSPTTPVDSRIRIPQHYRQQPIISRLISRYGVTVNIKAAMLAADENYGWFDLELQGNSEKICNSLLYLQNLGVDLIELGIAGNVQHKLSYQEFPDSPSQINQQKSSPFTMTTGTPIYQSYGDYIGQSHRLRLQLCILKDYYQTPVIFELVSRFSITVNIIAASLSANQQNDGWFDLDLWGKPQQLFACFNYLKELNLPLWLDASSLHGDIIWI
ncbi:NIL domain-containing protein [Aliinostoc sp. HNIBRCY26]|uniref:NIL domain-containing protein n=1 Tax=Aliinostoc sp. HNIBRCY26 TaxID=3418997 RepID=UPI003D03C438